MQLILNMPRVAGNNSFFKRKRVPAENRVPCVDGMEMYRGDFTCALRFSSHLACKSKCSRTVSWSSLGQFSYSPEGCHFSPVAQLKQHLLLFTGTVAVCSTLTVATYFITGPAGHRPQSYPERFKGHKVNVC